MIWPEVTIELYPAIYAFTDGFERVLLPAIEAGEEEVVYGGVIFRIRYTDDGRFKGVYVLIRDIDTPLPDVFVGKLRLNMVVLQSEIPDETLAKPGWYVGENFGLPGSACMFDPEGRFGGDGPRFYANGDSYDNVIQLYRRVMLGELEPGHDGNPVDGTIRH